MSNRLTVMRCQLASCRGGIDGCNGSECKGAKWDKVTPQWHEENIGPLVYWRVTASKTGRYEEYRWGCHTNADTAKAMAESKISPGFDIQESKEWTK
jgi:hypothetical protein